MLKRNMIAVGVAGVVTAWALLARQAEAQTTEAPYTYCMMTAYRATVLAKSTKLTLDCGDAGPYGQKLVDDVTGKAAKFNSSMDALNYMALQGFEDRGGYVLGADTALPTYVFLLRKR